MSYILNIFVIGDTETECLKLMVEILHNIGVMIRRENFEPNRYFSIIFFLIEGDLKSYFKLM